MVTTQFDPVKYKETTREQWQSAAEAWHRWGPAIEKWLGAATDEMLDLAGVQRGSRVLDVAAGAGGQTLTAARRVGPEGYVLATDISSNVLAYAARDARQAGMTNIETRVLDGESLDVEPGTFDLFRFRRSETKSAVKLRDTFAPGLSAGCARPYASLAESRCSNGEELGQRITLERLGQ